MLLRKGSSKVRKAKYPLGNGEIMRPLAGAVFSAEWWEEKQESRGS